MKQKKIFSLKKAAILRYGGGTASATSGFLISDAEVGVSINKKSYFEMNPFNQCQKFHGMDNWVYFDKGGFGNLSEIVCINV